MILFWITIILAVLIALLFILRPLLRQGPQEAGGDEDQLRLAVYRDNLRELDEEYKKGRIVEDQWRNARHELERSLLKETGAGAGGVNRAGAARPPAGRRQRLAAAFTAVLVMVSAFSLYYFLGNPHVSHLKELGRQADAGGDQASSLQAMVAPLEKHLQKNPGDANGLLLLARLYLSMAEYDKAVAAFERLYRMAGDVPDVMMAYVDALIRANDGSFAGKPAELIKRVLAVAPDNYTALFFAGLAADEAENYVEANRYYRKILPVLENNPQMSQTVNMLIEKNRQLIAAAGGEPAPEQATPTEVEADPAKSISLTVRVEEDLLNRFKPEDTLFVYAQAPGGSPPMPLAVVKARAGELPLDVTLDDSMAMMPEMRLSGFDTVRIQARISKSGNAMAEPGDLVGTLSDVRVADADRLELTINNVIR